MAKGKVVRPTVRFSEDQHRLIQAALQERGVSFQVYVNELICRDLGISAQQFEAAEAEGQLSVFDVTEDDTGSSET